MIGFGTGRTAGRKEPVRTNVKRSEHSGFDVVRTRHASVSLSGIRDSVGSIPSSHSAQTFIIATSPPSYVTSV